MELITTQQMTDLLEAKRGAACIGLIAVTDPGMNKTSRDTGCRNPFHGHIVKIQRGAAWINARYNKAVEKRVAKEINEERATDNLPPLEGEALTDAIDERFRKGENWQQLVTREDGTLTPFAEHKSTGVRYLRTMFLRKIGKAVYIDTRDGTQYTYEDMAEYLPVHRGSPNQGIRLENQVRYNVWKLRNIRALRMDGITYRVRPPLEQEAQEVFDALRERLDEIEMPQPDPDVLDALNG